MIVIRCSVFQDMYVTLVDMKWRLVVLVLFDVSGHIQHAALIDIPLSNCYTVY